MSNLFINKNKRTKQKGKFMENVSKMSRGFMIPIAILPIAGLLLGIGGSITGYPDLEQNNYALWTFGNIISVGGDLIFSNLPILFAVALAITFTKDSGGAGLAALVGYIVFNAFQSAFIDDNEIFWFIKAPDGFIDKNLGITSMSTSVFGGICIGMLAAYVYNHFSTKQLPGILNFFSGNRLVPILMFILVFPLAIAFLLIWPWIGKGLSWFGTNSAKAPIGLDSFLYGFGERTLLPFGLHHVFYLPLWQTAAGGSLALTDTAIASGNITINGNEISVIANETTWQQVLEAGRNSGVEHTAWDINNGGHSIIQGDQNLWQAAHGSGVNFVDLDNLFGINVGRFQQNYPIYLGGLTGACFAMWYCADSANKKQAAALLGTAAGTSFVTGITEPVEYTFLFVAPALFWGFHNIMSGLSAMLLNITGAHIGVTFSSGFIDLIIYGAVPVMQGTNFWWAIIFSAAIFPIYFLVFTWAIKKWNLKTPGRGTLMTKMITKSEYQSQKNKKIGPIHFQVEKIVGALGGQKNIQNVTACATRLRVDINDSKQISEKELKNLGAMGIIWTNNHHIQIVYGGKAEIYANLYNNEKASFETKEIEEDQKLSILKHEVFFNAPLSGVKKSLDIVPDQVFSQKILGEGLVIEVNPETKKETLISPCEGTVMATFPTQHAYGLKDKNGIEVLIHIGIDTVITNGEGFKALVEKGQQIKVGTPLVEVDFALIRKKVKFINPIIVITSKHQVKVTNETKITKNTKILTIS